MPFNSVPAKVFINRDRELEYLKLLTEFGDQAVSDNILLEGARGVGKTELLKQFYRTVFWERKNLVPFYYSFRKATLKASSFAKDYYTRFVRQYLAFMKKDPSMVDAMATPLVKLYPVMSALGLDWLISVSENFNALMKEGDTCEQVLGAISAPVIAYREGRLPVVTLLDDFPIAANIYESVSGDWTGLISLFEEPMQTSFCPHVITGSPEESLERLFANNSLLGKAERIRLGALPEDSAWDLFISVCGKIGMPAEEKTALAFVRFLGGNPLYIRNMAKSIRRMRKEIATESDLWDCYSFEITEGETAFYWSSVLREFIPDSDRIKKALSLLVQDIKEKADINDLDRMSKVLDMPVEEIRTVSDDLRMAGMVRDAWSDKPDGVMRDVIEALYMRIVERKPYEQIRQSIVSRRCRADSTSSFEMVIPMTSDAELVVAKAFEQIGRNMNLDEELVKQIQLALIESSLNAIEHSGSYEKKLSVKITAYNGRLELIIESPGRFFDPAKIEELPVEEKILSENKRGWGFMLMRKIMDEVKVERRGENTRVILIKNLKPGVLK